MSLINEMLKDIEARGGKDVAGGDVRPAAVARRSPPRRAPLAILVALVVVLAASIAYLATLRQSVSAQRQASTVVATKAPLERPAEPPAPVIADVAVPAQAVAEDVRVAEPVAENVSGPEAVAEKLPETLAGAAPVVPAVTATEKTDAVIVRRHEPTAAEKARRARLEGFAALQRGDWLAAGRLLDELVRMEPANDDAREGLAVAFAQQGRIAEADGVLLDGLAVGVEPARFAKLRARLQASQGQAAAALQSLAVAVPPVGEDPEFHALRGALAQQVGDYPLALETYRALVAYRPDNATWQAGLAMALDQAGDPAGARDAYRRALTAGGLEAALLEHVRRRLGALGK